MWETREHSIKALQNELNIEANNLYETFVSIENVIEIFQSQLQTSAFIRVTGLVFTKGINLARGILSLSLDGLAQEAGALLRPFVESLELLIYFRLDSGRVNKVLDNNLKTPSAGEIAKKVKGEYKELREHLNKYASHFSIGPESMANIINLNDGELRKIPPFNKAILRKNIIIVNVFSILLVKEAINCLLTENIYVPSELVETLESLRKIIVAQWNIESSA